MRGWGDEYHTCFFIPRLLKLARIQGLSLLGLLNPDTHQRHPWSSPKRLHASQLNKLQG